MDNVTIYRCTKDAILNIDAKIVDINQALTDKCSWILVPTYNSFAVINVSSEFHNEILAALGSMVEYPLSALGETPPSLAPIQVPVYSEPDELGEVEEIGTEYEYEIIKLWVQE